MRRIRGRAVEPENDDDGEPELTPTPLWKRKGVLILVGGLIIVLIFIFTRGPSPVIQTNSPDQTIGVSAPYEGAIVKAAAPASIVPPVATPPAAPQIPIPNFSSAAPKPTAPPPAAKPLMVYYPVHIEPRTEREEKEKEPAEPAKTKLKFAARDLPGTKASPAIDSTYMLMPGLLPIELDTAIDSNIPGPIFAHLPGPIYSPKGVLLMEGGSQIVGHYDSMQQNGVERLKASSVLGYTPNGIWVPLTGEPLTDSLGRAGLSGTIDHRYLERFGGAALIDLSKSALEILQAKVAKGGNTYVSFDSSDQLASQILQSTINLPPIFTKNQGSMIAIAITQPIDFSDSYRVTTR